MIRAVLLISLVFPIVAQAQTVPQQRLSLWTSHALQNSIQGSQLRINAQAGGALAPQLLSQAKVLYANGQDMLGASPKDPQYREWVAAVKRYDQLLWSIVGKPTASNLSPSSEDVQAVTLVNACTSRAIYQFQVRRLGGRLREVPDIDPLSAVQMVSLPASPGSSDVKQLALVSATIIKLAQTLPAAESPNTNELRYKVALEEILGVAGKALQDTAVPVVLTPPAPSPSPSDPTILPSGSNDPLPGNGNLPTPR